MTSRADELLDRLGDRAREQARAEARTAAQMLAFAEAREAEYEADGRPEHRDLELASIAHEIAIEMQMSVSVVQNRIHQAREVRSRAPRAWRAFLNGDIDGYRVQIISRALDSLRDPRSDQALDEKVIGYATTHTASELRASLKRLVVRLEPDRHAERARDRVDERRVCISHGDDGMSEIWGLWSTPVVMAIEKSLSVVAQSKPSDDVRTVDQCVADEFARRLLTRGNGEPDIQVQLAVTIPVTSLAGLSNEPGTSIDGQFCLSAETVRELASRPGTVFHRVITDPPGHVLDVTRLGRFATGELEFAIEVRDRVCQFPTCTRSADRCDKDHRTPWPHGPTNGSNLWSLCRRHHRMKTAGIFTADVDDNGDPTWHLPSGRRVQMSR